MSAPAFREQGMTFIEFAQDVIPGLSDQEADWVLWERTPFPLVRGRDDVMPYLVAERTRREVHHLRLRDRSRLVTRRKSRGHR